MEFDKTFDNYMQVLSEMPAINLRGKTVMAGDKPLKQTPTVDVSENIVMVRQPTSGGFLAEGFTLVYFMDTPEAAKDFADNKIPYLMVPRGTFTHGGSPITDIWKKKFQQAGQEHILGMIEANTMENSIYIDMMTVRAPYRRNGITSHMMNFIRERFPNAKLEYSGQTDDGKKFASKYEKGSPEKPTNSEKTVKGTIKYNSYDKEYVAKIWLDGKHHEPADYFTDDKEDAVNTLKNHMIPGYVEQGYTDITTI